MGKITKQELSDNTIALLRPKNWIINGGFDVWQRGTSVALADVTSTFLADRWGENVNKDGGTLPTLTRSKQSDLTNGFENITRLTTNGAGASLGVNSRHYCSQKIEHGTRKLCGLNKKVTLSFWARSDIANKRIGIYCAQSYGSGGSPSAGEIINGVAPFALTTTWTKYTVTITTNTLSGKTFGTGNDDAFEIAFMQIWGANYQSRVGASTPETYVGAGYVDIANVCLVQGDVAMDYQPESYEEVLRQCQRYYEKSYNQNTFAGAVNNSTGIFICTLANTILVNQKYTSVLYKVTKRIAGTPVVYSWAGTLGRISDGGAADLPVSAFNVSYQGEDGFSGYSSAGNTTQTNFIMFHWAVDAEL